MRFGADTDIQDAGLFARLQPNFTAGAWR
jgi:hypothetical protein